MLLASFGSHGKKKDIIAHVSGQCEREAEELKLFHFFLQKEEIYEKIRMIKIVVIQAKQNYKSITEE